MHDTENYRKMFKSSKIISNRLKYVNLVSNVARYGSDKVQICDVKSFEEIPGPRSYPIIGTLHKYAPFIGTCRFCVYFSIYDT